MHNDYQDILDLRPGLDPTWYDENGVPRYCDFSPRACPDIYADQVALLRIRCQSCDRPFLVQLSFGNLLLRICWPNTPTLVERCLKKTVHYGDPPNHACIGDTMNCEDDQVVELWRRGREQCWEWVRVPEGEGALGQTEE